MPPKHPAYDQALELVSKLRKLADPKHEDRGTLAALRSYWSPTTRGRALHALGRIAPDTMDEPATRIVAALFGRHRRHARNSNLGHTCAAIAGKEKETFEPHLRRLLAAREIEDDLDRQLDRIAKRAAIDDIPIDYIRLYLDLHDIDHKRWKIDDIKTTWAKAYYAVPADTEDEESA